MIILIEFDYHYFDIILIAIFGYGLIVIRLS